MSKNNACRNIRYVMEYNISESDIAKYRIVGCHGKTRFKSFAFTKEAVKELMNATDLTILKPKIKRVKSNDQAIKRINKQKKHK